jgi:hypothetical protein
MNNKYSILHGGLYQPVLPVILAALFCGGCAEQDSAITTDMHEDFDHDHKHQHTGDDDHEHDHEDGFRGEHTHGHSHGHRHGEPLHGGRIASIGHTHHKDGATHFHAEVMPLTDNTLRFHLLTETEDGKSADFPIEESEIVALVSIKGEEATASELTFKSAGDSDTASEFSAVLSEKHSEGTSFSVVIPKVRIGGQRQNFSFNVSRPVNDSETLDAEKPQEDSTDE